MKTHAVKFTTLASLMLGSLSLPLHAAVTYDGTDTSLLDTDPFWSTPGSLFPGGSLANNALNVVGGSIDGFVFGATVHGSDVVSGNVVVVAPRASFSPVVIGGMVAGGSAATEVGTAAANANKVIVSGGTLNSHAYGGYAYTYTYASGAAIANQNEVVVAGDAVVARTVAGSYAKSEFGTAEASGNTALVTDDAAVSGRVYGGFSESINNTATAAGNSVSVSGGVVGREVYGGFTYSINGASTATDNAVVVSGGVVKRDIAGGLAYSENNSATANNNSVLISGGTAEANVFGGYADSDQAGGLSQANNNRVVITGGTISGNVYGGHIFIDGFGEVGEATGNTVSIHAGADTSASMIYGGLVSDGASAVAGMDARSGNTLNLHGKGLVAVGIDNFETYNFHLADDVAASDTLLTLAGTQRTDLTGTGVNVHFAGGSTTLGEGDSLILIDATAGGIDGAPVQGGGMHGVTLQYGMDIDVLGDQLVGTVSSVRATDQSKTLSAGWLAGLALANQGTDMVANQGMDAAVNMTGRTNVQAAASAENSETSAANAAGDDANASKPANAFASNWKAFYAMGGGSLRYATGSHVSMDSFSLITGVAKGVDVPVGRLTIGGFFEYGYGSYDTYNTYASGNVNGDGIAHYYGGGMLVHMAFTPTGAGHFYAQASARGGAIDNSFGSSDFAGSLGTRASYDYTTAYYGVHLGAGYIWKCGKAVRDPAFNGLTIDSNVKFLWTTQSNQNVTMSTGDQLEFRNADSLRLRLSSRANYAVNDMVSLYGGLGWEYEFNGDADAKTNGFSIVAPTLCGGTGIGEMGVTISPFNEGKLAGLSFGLGVQGYVGKREGVTGSGQIHYSF